MNNIVVRVEQRKSKAGPFSNGEYWNFESQLRSMLRTAMNKHSAVPGLIRDSKKLDEEKRCDYKSMVGDRNWVCGIIGAKKFHSLFTKTTIKRLIENHEFQVVIYEEFEDKCFKCEDHMKQIFFDRKGRKPMRVCKTYDQYKAFMLEQGIVC